jgi:hypothetical protein
MTYDYHLWHNVLEEVAIRGAIDEVIRLIAQQYRVSRSTIQNWLT